jgi:succinate dehydrogenase / fumarate reductase iron-sulfur subunit
MRFQIYRYDPDRDAVPRMQDYDINLEPSDTMLLDALVRIKAEDDSLSLRRSCREGVCGSDAMNINGKNGLACITRLADLKEPRLDRGHVPILQTVSLGQALPGQQFAGT